MSERPIPVGYVAGPYRSGTECGVARNIAIAEDIAKTLWQAGAAAICPHKNTAWLGGLVPDQAFLDGDLEILRRCDFVVTCSNWMTSEGARVEVAVAKKYGIPVFHDMVAARAWILNFGGRAK